ncbi:MAG: PDZ domain-containing protein, partial [Planctomycetota bacterium]|nr:PDZ domain-containing protein [Planctomycetota bacterium]
PNGGGQPGDQGTITTSTGTATVQNTLSRDGVIRHLCQLTDGLIEAGQQATLALDWERRYKYMRIHTAGHIIHDVLMDRVAGLAPGRGDHGSKAFIEYNAPPDIEIDQDALEAAVNAIVQAGRDVITRQTDFEELNQLARSLPPTLARFKTLRMIQIDGFPAMPDGGVQVANLTEIVNIDDQLHESRVERIKFKRGRNTKTGSYKQGSQADAPSVAKSTGKEQPLPLHKRAFLGAEFKESNEGPELTRVVSGAAASRAKLKTGDVILRLGKTDINSLKKLVDALSVLPKRTKTRIYYRRAGRRLEGPIVLSDAAEAAGVIR